MKQTTTNNRRKAFRAAIEAAGIDTNKDFYTLSCSEQSILCDLAKTFKYRKNANYPGSLARAFYYSAQRAK